MTCFHPVQATQSFEKKSNGKYKIKFGELDPNFGNPIELPCGQCAGCRLEKSRQWAIRCFHESQCYENNCFLTLTYNNKNLPSDGSVNVEHFQLFMKRLRKKFVPINPYSEETQKEKYDEFRKKYWIRFFHCGEYGDELQRPHYHACLFNFDFNDKELYSSEGGQFLYTSETLDEIWGLGKCWIGEVTFESAAYVARYIMKKITGDSAQDHYTTLDKETGQYWERKPEYVTMSRRPGIGQPWLADYQADVYPHDNVIIKEKKVRPPKYYDTQFQLGHPEKFESLKEKRILKAKPEENTDARLRTKKRLTQLNLNRLKRPLHED